MTDTLHDDLLSFQVDSSLLVQLGEQLVARRSIALAELVKNAYDADATQVRVVMQDVKTPSGSILVDDNGVGMTLDEVRTGWMRVATTAKARNPFSPVYGRARAGSKGIGRFAARRLGGILLLSSIAQYSDGTKRCLEIEFNWRDDFVAGTDIGATKVAYVLKDVPASTPTGTALLIEDLGSETWDESDVEDLQRDLLSLTPPFEVAEPLATTQSDRIDPGFSVHLEAPEFPGLGGEIKDHFLEAAWGVLTGHVGPDGRPHYALQVRKTGKQVTFSPSDVIYRSVGQVSLKVHFMVYRADAFEGFALVFATPSAMGETMAGYASMLMGFESSHTATQATTGSN